MIAENPRQPNTPIANSEADVPITSQPLTEDAVSVQNDVSVSPAPSNRTAGTTFASSGSPYYATTIAIFASLLLISNISATKGVTFGPIGDFPINTDGGFILFPLAYVLGDILSEVYGFKATRQAIILGFAIAILGAVTFQLVIVLPGAEYYTGQESFETVLGLVPLILIASIAGFIVGQTLNSLVVVVMKRRTNAKHMWARLIGSTIVGEFADTLIFCSIAAPLIGFTTFGECANYVVLGFLYKTAVEAAMLPITYPLIRWFKRREPSYALTA